MKKFLLIGAVVVLAALLLICACNYKWIYYRIYPFDRITGEYEISVNGHEIDAVEKYYMYDESDRISLKNSAEEFHIKGGKYGRYSLGFVLDSDVLFKLTNDDKFKESDNIDLSVVYFNSNWWHISELDIEIDIVKENDEWYVYYDIDLEEPIGNTKITTTEKIKLDEIGIVEIIVGI